MALVLNHHLFKNFPFALASLYSAYKASSIIGYFAVQPLPEALLECFCCWIISSFFNQVFTCFRSTPKIWAVLAMFFYIIHVPIWNFQLKFTSVGMTFLLWLLLHFVENVRFHTNQFWIVFRIVFRTNKSISFWRTAVSNQLQYKACFTLN